MDLKNYFLSLLIIFSSFLSFGQDEKYTLSGTLKDASSGEDLIGARVTVVELPGTGAITNEYGFYSLTLPKGTYTVQYKSLGFDQGEFTVELTRDIQKNVELQPTGRVLNKVDVTAERADENVRSTEMGVDKLSMADIENIPVLFGENTSLSA